MGVNRRRVLRIAGATVLAGAGALTWRAVDQAVFSAGTGAVDPFLREIMPFRIGYPTVEAKSSPRRDLKSVLV